MDNIMYTGSYLVSTHSLDVSTCTPLCLDKTQTSGDDQLLTFLGSKFSNRIKHTLCLEHSCSRQSKGIGDGTNTISFKKAKLFQITEGSEDPPLSPGACTVH